MDKISKIDIQEAKTKLCPYINKNCVGAKCMFWYRGWFSRSSRGMCRQQIDLH